MLPLMEALDVLPPDLPEGGRTHECARPRQGAGVGGGQLVRAQRLVDPRDDLRAALVLGPQDERVAADLDVRAEQVALLGRRDRLLVFYAAT